MAKQLRNKIADINKHKFVEATLIDAVGGLCAVKIGGKRGNGGVLRGIPFIGPAGEFGQKVYIDYSSGKPIVQIFGQPQEQSPVRRTIRGRPVNSEPASEGGSSTPPTVADHVHDAIYLSGTSDPMYYDPTDAGFAAACTAAQDGDTIIMPNGLFNGPVTLPYGVNLVGSGDTTIQYVLTTGGNQTIENVKFFQSLAGQQYCVDIPNTGADNVNFYDCQFYNGTGTSDIWLINMWHGGQTQAEFWNCFFQIYASAHNGYAFYSGTAHGSPASASTKTYFCSYEIRCITSGTPLLWNSNCKIGVYSVSWGPTDLTPGSNVFYLSGDRYTASAAASGVSVVTTNFDGILSSSDSDVQSALETIDDLDVSSVSVLDDLDDVIIAAPTAGDTLIYVGSTQEWLDSAGDKSAFTATCSTGTNEQNSIDGDDGTYFGTSVSQAAGQWLSFDLGSSMRITKMDFYTPHGDYIISAKIQASTTGAFAGEEVYLTSSSFAGVNGHKEVVFDQNVDFYRYYRLYLTGGNGWNWLKIYEVDFYRDDGSSHWENSPATTSAENIDTDTSGFNGNLSAADDTVQKALDTLDDLSITAGVFNDISWALDGYIAAQTNASRAFVVPRASTIEKVIVYLKDTGTAGSTVIDVNKNGTSIFSSNPTVAYNDADKIVSSVPTTTSVAENDVLTVDIDSIATGAQDLIVQVHFVVDNGEDIDPTAIHDNESGEINAITEKTTPVGNDLLLIEDSADTNAKKKLKISNLPFVPSSSKGEKIFTREGSLTVSSGVIRIANHSGATRTITGVYLDADTAPTGSAIIVDIHKDGTTIFTTQSNRPQIAATANSGNSTTIEVSSWADGAYLTCDVDQIGSITSGSNLTVTVVYS